MIIFILSTVWFLSLVLRVLYLYNNIGVNFIILLFSDLGIGLVPPIIIFGISIVREAIEKNRKKAGRKCKGKDPKFLPLITKYLETNYPKICEECKNQNLVLKWEFEAVGRNDFSISEIVGHRKEEGDSLKNEQWIEGKLIFVENPSE